MFCKLYEILRCYRLLSLPGFILFTFVVFSFFPLSCLPHIGDVCVDSHWMHTRTAHTYVIYYFRTSWTHILLCFFFVCNPENMCMYVLSFNRKISCQTFWVGKAHVSWLTQKLWIHQNHVRTLLLWYDVYIFVWCAFITWAFIVVALPIDSAYNLSCQSISACFFSCFHYFLFRVLATYDIKFIYIYICICNPTCTHIFIFAMIIWGFSCLFTSFSVSSPPPPLCSFSTRLPCICIPNIPQN